MNGQVLGVSEEERDIGVNVTKDLKPVQEGGQDGPDSIITNYKSISLQGPSCVCPPLCPVSEASP
jgi:hypothetical protein